MKVSSALTVRELIGILLQHDMDGMVGVFDRSSFDAAKRIMHDPETHPDVVLGLGLATLDGPDQRLTNDIAEVKRIKDGDFGTLFIITGRTD